ncbi:CaiB/baiF CoA-transferase family protein [Ceratobasidium theobromae]|uniref:CaiB/baiF CoA-transferase family protein n=1 Tax=Ceratobasidium theobromae TaxID=1582974 RepID=A0A5N5QCH4_9AGAM|nr:CaiB/baiF CoA-transferase family protein [Ceratobasidium theobromae]
MVRYAAAAHANNPEKTARARGEYLRTHFKNMREVAAALTGLKLTKAYTYIENVKDHKQVIPFRRFSGGVGRASQAKEFGATQGRWPEKSLKFILRLLKNAESNADAKNLELDDLSIKNIVVQQAPKTRRRTYRAHGRINPYQGHPCHVEIILAASDEEVERNGDKDAVAKPVVAPNRRVLARRRIEAGRARLLASNYAAPTRSVPLLLSRRLQRDTTLPAQPGGIPPPLKGIRVVDLTRVLAGPTATMLLADLGADVIKIEEVKRGDDTRSWSPPSAPVLDLQPSNAAHLPAESAYFLAANRNKRSVTVNFKDPRGLEIVHDLVRKADVLVENFIAGKLASMGLGWEDCKKINERLIYASITGYGQTGPYRQAAGYDVVIEGEAGLMHMYASSIVPSVAIDSVHDSTGEPDGPPCKVGVAVTDISTGLYAHGAIMAGLLSRQQTGKGMWIDCNLFETQASLCYFISGHTDNGSRHGTSHPSIVPYQVFPCKDGFIMIGAGNEKQFALLADKVLGKPELATDIKFSTNGQRVKNRAELVQIITNALMQENRDHWLKKFQGLGVPHGPINNIAQTFDHPQAKARGVVVEVEHPRAGNIKMVAPPVHYNGKRMPVTRPPPYLSQHTEEVLSQDLGYSAERIAELRAQNII